MLNWYPRWDAILLIIVVPKVRRREVRPVAGTVVERPLEALLFLVSAGRGETIETDDSRGRGREIHPPSAIIIPFKSDNQHKIKELK